MVVLKGSLKTYCYEPLILLLSGVYIFNARKMWEKMVLAARAIAAIENPADVFVISSRPYGQRAVLKYAVATGATPIAGRFTPGTFTNYIQVGMIVSPCIDRVVECMSLHRIHLRQSVKTQRVQVKPFVLSCRKFVARHS